ncbi:MAG TPA: hypothetical protein VGV15_00185 [Terriglobales bacterium]|nr:hypothetical protein [Terriglobales bacterium]
MNTTQAATATARQMSQAVLPRDNEFNAANLATPRRAGYGLPCAKCKTYYSADLDSCPVCRTPERVSPVPTGATAPIESEPEFSSDEAALEAERERFLREFKSQVYASHMQINAAASFRCSKEENHQGAFEPAAVCQNCYDQVRGELDLMEAALHMDLKEATQIVYDAVWSDPSDPGKTYQNAAQALLTELRNRAGISAVLGPLQTLPH